MSTYYLIDYENVHDSGLKGIDNLGYDDCVFIFYTVYANKVSLDALEGIQTGLRVIRVLEGYQSLDRHLISYLGFLIGQGGDQDTRFQVISRDNGYRKIIEFWNRWFGMDDKVCQRASIVSQEVVSEPVPYFTSDGRTLTKRGIQLRHAIIQHMRNQGEKSRNGHWCMMVSTLCSYLSSLSAYQEEREASGKKPMPFLQEEMNDILVIRHERNSDFAYLISDQEYWEFPEFEQPTDIAETEFESDIDEVIPIVEKSSVTENRIEPIEAIVRATFENDGERDEAGQTRVKASLLRDRLEKLDGYHLSRQESGKKPLEYLAETLADILLIRVIKSRSWAYLLEDDDSTMEFTDEELAIPGEENSENNSVAASQPSMATSPVETMSPFEQSVYEKMIAIGKDATVAASIAGAAATALFSDQPKATFHSRLWQQFGQKLGTKYYRETISLIDFSVPPSSEYHSSSYQTVLPAEVKVEDMGLSARSTNSLKRAGYHTAVEFIGQSDDELLKIQDLGQKGIDEIRNWVQMHLQITSLAT